MPRYYFHLHECGTVIEDDGGVECKSIEEAQAVALEAARELMCAELAHGRLCLSCRIDVTDEADNAVLTVPFKDAVTITGL